MIKTEQNKLEERGRFSAIEICIVAFGTRKEYIEVFERNLSSPDLLSRTIN